MFQPNVKIIESQIQPTDRVLDIGGWAQPFNRANTVIDAMPYETRGWYKTLGMQDHLGEGPECFDASRWIQRDICDRSPFPFADKSFDYVICSHVLEDIRDPLWVCSEIIRIGKRGYIEVPSRLCESTWNSLLRIAGAPHHRWLVDIKGNHIRFEMKYPLIHRKGLHLPSSTCCTLQPNEAIQYLFWESSFTYDEASLPMGSEDIEQRLRHYVDQNRRKIPFLKCIRWSIRTRWARIKKWIPPSCVPLLKSLRKFVLK